MNKFLPFVVLLATAGTVSCAGKRAPFLQPTPERRLERIAFGSCNHQSEPQTVWYRIWRRATDGPFGIGVARPDLFILLGDNVYASFSDRDTTDTMRAFYAKSLGANEHFQRVMDRVPLLATWDDNDFGPSDSGADYSGKDASRAAFLDFFRPGGAAARTEPGIYEAHIFGPPGQRVQVILLDNRYFRSPLKRATPAIPGKRGAILQDDDPEKTMLGERQWAWLAEQLRMPAEVRLLCNGTEVLNTEHPFERWDAFPHERQRLFDTIRDTRADGVLLLSGDRHHGEISMLPSAEIGYPLFEIVSSGLTRGWDSWREPGPNRHRIAILPWEDHYAELTIDWDATPSPMLEFGFIRADEYGLCLSQRVPLSALRFPEPSSHEAK